MTTTSIQLPDGLRNDLKCLAEKTGKSQSDLVREFIAIGLKRRSMDLSLAERLGSKDGHFDGPADLSLRKAFED